jgi:hypothetical protein
MRLNLSTLNLERIKLVAEIAAAVAVVLSLLFVGLQVRESALQTELNTAAVEVSAYQDLMAQIAEFNRMAVEDPDVARIQTIGDVSLSTLPPVEQRRHIAMVFLMLRHGDMAYLQYERGMLDENRMYSAMAPLRAWLRYCSTRDVWAQNRDNYVPSYRSFVDSFISSNPTLMTCREPAEPATSGQ